VTVGSEVEQSTITVPGFRWGVIFATASATWGEPGRVRKMMVDAGGEVFDWLASVAPLVSRSSTGARLRWAVTVRG
jgi:hypothetical protein